MKKLILMGLVALLLCGASATGSWFWQNQMDSADAENRDAGSQAEVADQPLTAVSATEPIALETDDISVETLLRLVGSIKGREKALDERQELIRKREDRLGLVLDDVEREQKEIGELNAAIDRKFEQINGMVSQITSLPSQRTASGTGNTAGNPASADGIDQRSLTKMADWLKGMPPESSAASIREFVNDGKIGLVAQILMKLDERDASKMLAALGDERLIKEIVEEVLRAKADAGSQ